MCYFWPILAVWAKNSTFLRFWPISKNGWPRLLYTVGISDFFLNFWDQKKSKKSKKFFFLFNGPPYFQMKIGDRNIEVRGPIFGMWPTTIIYNGNLSEMKWSLTCFTIGIFDLNHSLSIKINYLSKMPKKIKLWISTFLCFLP